MKIRATLVALLIAASSGHAAAAGRSDPICKTLRAFVGSVGPGQVRTLAFHTSWGSNFKNAASPAGFAKECVHHGYAPAEPACQALMEHGAVESSNTNAERAVVCLASGTRFGKHVALRRGSISLRYGNKDRGSYVTVEYGEDLDRGGMVLRVTAEGY